MFVLRHIWTWLLLVVLALGVGACYGRGAALHKAPLRIAGSTSMLPLLEPLAAAFTQATGRPVRLNLVGSTAGLVALEAGAADLAAVSRALSPAEAAWATPHAVARDGLAVVVHPRRAGLRLTLTQLQRVLSGEIQRWEQLAPARQPAPQPASPGPLRVVLREEGSGTRDALLDVVQPPAIRLDALVQGSSGAVAATVAADPNALGVISMYALSSRVHAVPVNGVLPTAGAIAGGRYPLARSLYLCTQGETAPARDFFAFIDSPEGRRAIAAAGFVPEPRPEPQPEPHEGGSQP